MMRRSVIAGMLTGLVLGVPPLTAHDDYRVVGTITKVQGKRLEVKTRENKMFSIKMDDLTLVTRDKTKISAADLKPGLSVVVDARGDNEADLLALEVRIVPAVATPAKNKKQ